ncbi:ribosome maturation factor RimP [Glutamicibacter arilaitensis]|uniref:ribosome maturation factor RimP n=1 Tax=Glutamicibacter arilaitensis TaxID=256701 RepID=UPI003A8EF931
MTGMPADTEQEAQRLTALLSKEVESHGLLLEEVSLRPSGKQMIVQVIVDKADGHESLNLDELGEVTTTISNALDKDAVYASAAPYELEVSSPGLSRPLTAQRHWIRAINRMVKISLADGTKLRGRLLEVNDSDVLVAEHREPAKKGMKVKVLDPATHAFENIRKAVVDPELNFDDALLDTIDTEDLEG